MTSKEIFRRAGGRRKYQALRRHEALLRRGEIIEQLKVLGFQRGTQATIARLTGWSEATISRDFKRICERFGPCPKCGAIRKT
jgi:arginine repressor